MPLLYRNIQEGRITRIYPKGGIFLCEPGESLEEMSSGAIPPDSPQAELTNKCILCDRPSVHYGLFMTREAADIYLKKGPGHSTGTFFGMCSLHDPHKDEEEVCAAVYKVMEDHLSVKDDLELAEGLMNEWFENLTGEGYTEKQSVEIMLRMLEEGKFTEGHDFPKSVKSVMEVALRDRLGQISD